MPGFLVIRQIIAHHLAYVEVIGKLKGQYRIEYFFLLYFIYVLFRTNLIRIFIIVGNTSTEHNSFQIQSFAKLLAVFVHTACQAKSTVLGMNKDFNTI